MTLGRIILINLTFFLAETQTPTPSALATHLNTLTNKINAPITTPSNAAPTVSEDGPNMATSKSTETEVSSSSTRSTGEASKVLKDEPDTDNELNSENPVSKRGIARVVSFKTLIISYQQNLNL